MKGRGSQQLSISLKQNKELSSFTLERYPYIKKFGDFDFFWFAVVVDYLKSVQDETTKRFLVGNTKINIIFKQSKVTSYTKFYELYEVIALG